MDRDRFDGPISIDVGEVSFIDSSGLKVLIELVGRADEAGRSVILERPCASVVRLVEMMALPGCPGLRLPILATEPRLDADAGTSTAWRRHTRFAR